MSDDFYSVDIEPSDDEIVDEVIDEPIIEADEDDDWSYSAIDDRWDSDGVPSWSAWA